MITKTLPQLVQKELERLILSGELRAGERLNEIAIASRLKVSRGPVREALRTLEEAGLVCFEKNRGATVRVISPEEAIEIYDIRASLEKLACRRFAMRVAPEQVAQFRLLIDRMQVAADANDTETFSEVNTSFHDLIVEFAGNNKLVVIYRRLISNLTLFRTRALVQEGHLHQSNAEHRCVVEQLAAGDGSKAGRLIHEHIESSGLRIQNSLRSLKAENAGVVDAKTA